MKITDVAQGKQYHVKGDIVRISSIDEKPNLRTSVVHFEVVKSNSKARPIGYTRSWSLASFTAHGKPVGTCTKRSRAKRTAKTASKPTRRS